MVVTEQVQRTMDQEVRQLFSQSMAAGSSLTEGSFGRNHHIAQDVRVQVGKRPFAHGKCQHVCGAIDAPIARV